jgi:hypothetical protein
MMVSGACRRERRFRRIPGFRRRSPLDERLYDRPSSEPDPVPRPWSIASRPRRRDGTEVRPDRTRRVNIGPIILHDDTDGRSRAGSPLELAL